MISLAAGLKLSRNVLSDAAVDHIVGLVPADESLWVPCIGQVEELASKRCTLILVDADVQRSLAAISTTFGVDTSALDMLPIIRYLPGAPPVGVHGRDFLTVARVGHGDFSVEADKAALAAQADADALLAAKKALVERVLSYADLEALPAQEKSRLLSLAQ